MTKKLSILCAVCLLMMVGSTASAAVVGTVRVSVSSDGEQQSGPEDPYDVSKAPAISADGRWVAFESNSSNLVPRDDNHHRDVFMHDLRSGRTELVSVSDSGLQGNGRSERPSVSGDGRWVAFESMASNLVPGDTNDHRDVFVHDMQTGSTQLVSVSGSGIQGNLGSDWASISDDGRRVAFETQATNLFPGDSNSCRDIFVRDLYNKTTTLVTVNSRGEQARNDSGAPAIDGHRVIFYSIATNLVAADSNRSADVFMHNLRTGKTRLVSVSSSGAQGDSHSVGSSISGHRVAFTSDAANLVPHDNNGTRDAFVHNLWTGKTILVSRNSSGQQGTDDSAGPVIGGHRIAFWSLAGNLVSEESPPGYGVFVRDLRTRTTELVSVTNSGEIPNGRSLLASISEDGMRVAFWSEATNLVPNDTNGVPDIFVHGRLPHL
jgi:Tol biopolymer transport system component